MLTAAKFRDSMSYFSIKSINPSNTEGLVKHNSKIYTLHGYINLYDTSDRHEHSVFGMNMPLWASLYNNFGVGPNSPLERKDWREMTAMQLKASGVNIDECHLAFYGFNTVFVFTYYRKPISISRDVTKLDQQAIYDYTAHHKYIPQIVSDYALAGKLARVRSTCNKFNIFYPDEITTENLPAILGYHPSIKKETRHTLSKEEQSKLAEKKAIEQKNNEASIIKKSDYSEFQQQTGFDLNALHQRIVSQAKRTGGFVDFNYKGQIFKIPKLPLIAWATSHNKNAVSFDYNGETWRVYSPEDLKCQNDGQFHSDWWIGAGIPIRVYSLAGGGLSHQTFNREVSDFAFEQIKCNTLENFPVLAGSNLAAYRGRVNYEPKSIEDVKEGDILILPNGGVKFDLYLKKACANGRGVVILEVGNRVSHLSIVANELGYRVILLPNIKNLLNYATEIEVDMKNKTIKKIYNH